MAKAGHAAYVGLNEQVPITDANAVALKETQAAVSGGVGSFSQFGFLQGEILAHALRIVKGPYTVTSVNRAIRDVKDFTSAMLCRPFSYGKLPLHIPNHTDYTTTPDNGKMVIAQGCRSISSADPILGRYYQATGQR